jgi:hypothetical protein
MTFLMGLKWPAVKRTVTPFERVQGCDLEIDRTTDLRNQLIISYRG